MEDKRRVSILVPYKVQGGRILVYLQKRAKDAERLPDQFGFFGGGAERDENPEQALRREIREEMNFVPERYKHFKKYEFDRSIKDIFIAEVDEGFTDKITILEGEYGKWFDEEEGLNEPKLIEEDKTVLKDFYENHRIRNSEI